MTMDTKALLVEAEALKPQLLTDRRTLHHAPEVGPSLPRTAAYVTERLTALGYTPRPLAGGVVADITGEDTGPVRAAPGGYGRSPGPGGHGAGFSVGK